MKYLRRIILTTCLLAIIVYWVMVPDTAHAAAHPQKPNIIFFLTDDQGWRDVGFNGTEFFETPNLDRIAHEGMNFIAAYSGGPNCAPARACIMTGMYTPRHKIYIPGGASKGDITKMELDVPVLKKYMKGASLYPAAFEVSTRLDPSVTSIAEILNEAGYATARIGKWHLGPDTQGFDLSTSDGVSGPDGIHHSDKEVAYRMTDRSIQFIEENRDNPFFLYLCHYDPHTPIVAHKRHEDVIEKYRIKKASDPEAFSAYNPIYAAMVEVTDWSMGRLLETLERLHLEDNTIVIFVSDNGGIPKYTSNEPLRGGKGSLYEGGVRVPLAIRWPAVIEAGSTCETVVTGVDFLPTLAELAGGTLPNNQPIDGRSFALSLRGHTQNIERSIYWHFPLYLSGAEKQNYIPYSGGRAGFGEGWRATPASSVRLGDWKVIEYFGVERNRVELYNLSEDPGEKNDLSSTMPDKAKELHGLLRSWRRRTDAVEPKNPNPYFGKEISE